MSTFTMSAPWVVIWSSIPLIWSSIPVKPKCFFWKWFRLWTNGKLRQACSGFLVSFHWHLADWSFSEALQIYHLIYLFTIFFQGPCTPLNHTKNRFKQNNNNNNNNTNTKNVVPFGARLTQHHRFGHPGSVYTPVGWEFLKVQSCWPATWHFWKDHRCVYVPSLKGSNHGCFLKIGMGPQNGWWK